MEALIWVMQQTRGGLELRRLGRLTRGLHGRTQRTAVRAAVAEPLHRYDACGLQPAPDAWTATCQLILAPPVVSSKSKCKCSLPFRWV